MEISSDRVQSKLVCTSNNHQMNIKTSSAEEQTNLLCSYIMKNGAPEANHIRMHLVFVYKLTLHNLVTDTKCHTVIVPIGA